MIFLLRGWLAFLGFLVISGGTFLKTSVGKIEVASVDPFALGFGVLLLFAYRFRRDVFDSFLDDINKALSYIMSKFGTTRHLAVLVSLVFGGVFIAHLFKHYSFSTNLYDMGFVNQALFHPFFDGTFLRSSLSPKESYLVDHFSPTLLFLSPVTAIMRSNTVVFFLQACLLGLGVYLLVAKGPLREHPKYFIIFGFILLCNRSLRSGGIWDFREDVLAFLFLTLTILFLWRGKVLLYFVSLLLYVLSKEHLGIIALGLTLPIFFDQRLPYSIKKRTLLGISTFGALIAWSATIFWLIIPWLQEGIGEVSNIPQRFGAYGSDTRTVIVNLLFSPAVWWSLVKTKCLTVGAFKYVALMILPYIFFARFSWPWIVAAFGGFAANIFSDSWLQRTLDFHYDVSFLPFLMFGTMMGGKKYLDMAKPGTMKNGLLVGLFAALSFSGRWPLSLATRHLPTVAQVDDAFFLASVACEGTIAANTKLLAHLTHCPDIRALNLPEACDHVGLEFKRNNSADSSRLAGHGAINASEFLIDESGLCEKALGQWLIRKHHNFTKTISPSGRYSYIRVISSS